MDVQAAFQALGDPTRRRVLSLLHGHERPAGDLAQQFEVSWPTVSRHLAVLKGAGLVTTRREGRHVLYSLSKEALAAVTVELEGIGGGSETASAHLAGTTTDQAASMFQRAVDVAWDLYADHVGTHHLLLALLSGPDGTAKALLDGAGVSFDRARSKAGELFPAAPSRPARPAQLRFEWACKTVISGAIPAEAIKLGHRFIGTAVQLLALVNEVERGGSAPPTPGKAALVLQALGVDLDQLRDELHAELEAARPGDGQHTDLDAVLSSLGTNYQLMWDMFVGLESQLDRRFASMTKELEEIKAQLSASAGGR